MRYALLLLPMALLTGCVAWHTKTPIAGDETATVQADDLTVSLHMPKRTLIPGEAFTAVIKVCNHSNRRVNIEPGCGALAYLIVQRQVQGSFVETKRFPELAATQQKAWHLEPGKTREFPLSVVVAPDWPTCEPLQLVGQLNGRPDVQPNMIIQVIPQPFGTQPQ